MIHYVNPAIKTDSFCNAACFDKTSSASNRMLLTKNIKNKNKKHTKKYSSISFIIYKKSSLCLMPIIFYTINHRSIDLGDPRGTVSASPPSGF